MLRHSFVEFNQAIPSGPNKTLENIMLIMLPTPYANFHSSEPAQTSSASVSARTQQSKLLISISYNDHAMFLEDNLGILDAVKIANIKKLHEIYAAAVKNNDGLTQITAATAYSRVTLAFSKANDVLLQGCQQRPIATPNVKLLCSSMLLGNYFIARDMDAWENQVNYIRKTYVPTLLRGNPWGSKAFAPTYGIEMLSKTPWPKISQHQSRLVSYIPYVSNIQVLGKSKVEIPMVVDVMVGGIRTQALMDTGTSMTAISKKLAENLKIKPLFSFPSGSFLTLDNRPYSIGAAPSIQLGGVTIRNWPVVVVDNLPLPIVLGLPLMSKLGRLTLGGKGVEIDLRPNVRQTCKEPLRIGSSMNGSQVHLITTIKIGRKRDDAVIDTGDNDELSATVRAPFEGQEFDKSQTLKQANGRLINEKYHDFYSNQVVFGSTLPLPMKYRVYLAPHNYASKLGFQIGAGVLSKRKLVLDFTRKTMCFK